MEEQWLNKMRQKMEDYKEPAPQGLWDDIEATMHQLKPAPVPIYRKVAFWAAGFGTAAAAIIAIFLIIGNDFPHSPIAVTPKKPQLAMNSEKKPTTVSHAASDLTNESNKYLAVSSKPSVQKQRNIQAKAQTDEKQQSASLAKVSKDEQPQEVHKNKPTPNSNPDKAFRKKRLYSDGRNSDERFLYTKSAESRRKERFSASLYTGNLPRSSEKFNDYGELVTGNTLPQHFEGQPWEDDAPVRDIIYSNLGKDIKTKIRHKLPIRFGLSFRYHFNDRLSLESGLTYTLLNADLTSGSNRHHYNSTQRLQYLGIPLNVNYDFWKNRHWNFYGSVGGSIEKCIHGQLDTDYILDNTLISSDSKHIMEKPVQFSANAALGAQFNITSKFGIYAEPGMAYYFDNGSPVETIYKDKPFNFSFKLGIRLSFR